MNGDQARAVLPVLRRYEYTRSFHYLLQQVTLAVNSTVEAYKKALQPTVDTLKALDPARQAKRRHEMIYGRLDGRRPKR
jgi:hypothetical protein